MITNSETTVLLTNKEAAVVLGFSPTTLNNARYTGILSGVTAPPFRKLGKAVRYDRNDLVQWLNQFTPQINTSQHSI